MADNPKGPSGPRRQRALNSAKDGSRRITRRAFVQSSAGAALAIGGVSSLLTARRAASQTGSGTVVVMAWENYVHPEIQKRFKEATGITVRGIAGDSDQDMFTKLKAGRGDQNGVVLASDR